MNSASNTTTLNKGKMMDNLLIYQIDSPFKYFILAICSSLFVRIFISLFESLRVNESKERGEAFKSIFLGIGIKIGDETKAKDYCLGFLIGCMEMSAYPILMVTNHIEILGGWLLFKTVNRVNYQKTDRGQFNRYLVANALMLFLSYMIARFLLFN